MDRWNYMKPPFDMIPREIINEYNFTDISHNGKVYTDIRKGIYGLPQAGIILHGRLKITRRSKDINLLYSPQDSGPANPDPSPSTSSLLNLESSM